MSLEKQQAKEVVVEHKNAGGENNLSSLMHLAGMGGCGKILGVINAEPSPVMPVSDPDPHGDHLLQQI
jgi:hypothetical protein